MVGYGVGGVVGVMVGVVFGGFLGVIVGVVLGVLGGVFVQQVIGLSENVYIVCYEDGMIECFCFFNVWFDVGDQVQV